MGERSTVAGALEDHGDIGRRGFRTLRVKMVLLGSSGVGKSSLALRFSKDDFKNSSPTVGCAYLTHMVHLGDVTVRFEIWDTAGQEKYHSVTPLYYRGAHAALVVYDITNRDTFLRAHRWLRELQKQYIPGSTVIALVANKGDLHDQRQVPMEEGQRIAVDNDLLFMETSALSGHQVSELLLAIAHRVKQSLGEQQGELTEFKDTSLVDLNRGTFNPFTPCCFNAPPP